MLRQYQIELINSLKNSWKAGHKRPCIVLPCGGGKSVICAEIAKRVTVNKRFVLFVVHRLELVSQITNTFKAWGVDMNYCLIGMIQTINRQLDKIPKPSLIITDENHHSLANTYKKVYSYFPDVHCVGVTATPVRLNGGGLGEVNDDLIIGVTAKWLIANGYLAPYKYYSVPVADLSGVRTNRGEYDAVQLSEIMENDRIYGDSVKHYERLANSKKAIVYCSSVKSAYETAKEFRNSGYLAEALDGKSSKDHREKTMDDFRNGKITILCNNELFGEGLDIQDVDCVILLRKTKSLTLFIQQSMRCMRIDKNNRGKVAIIIDHVGNVYEHGFPDDDRRWSLDPKPVRQESLIKIKECPVCYAVVERNILACPYCGYDFSEEELERREKERIEAELEELKSTQFERLKSMPYSAHREFKTFSELDDFRKAKGYKFLWTIREALSLGIYIPEKYNKLKGMVT